MENRNLLSMDEVLLLENLVYLSGQKDDSALRNITAYEGVTVEEFLKKINISEIENNAEYTSYTTGEDWKDIIQAVKNNDTLMNMKIATTHIDNAEGGGGGVSAVFLNEETGESVVAFRGTAEIECRITSSAAVPPVRQTGYPPRGRRMPWTGTNPYTKN